MVFTHCMDLLHHVNEQNTEWKTASIYVVKLIRCLIHTTVNCNGLWCFLPLCLKIGHKYSSFELCAVQPKTDISKVHLAFIFWVKNILYIISWGDLLVDAWKGFLSKFSLLPFNHLCSLLVHSYLTCRTH